MNAPTQNTPHPATSTASSPHPARHRIWPFVVGDLVLVLVFAAIGRASHGESLAGLPVTAWPFLLGTCLAWAVVILRDWTPGSLAPTGLVVWLATVVIGMLTRTAIGQGTHWSFMLVTLVVTGVFLLGARALASWVGRLRSRRRR